MDDGSEFEFGPSAKPALGEHVHQTFQGDCRDATFSRIDAVELRSVGQNESPERWSELTSTRFGPVVLTFSRLRSSRSTSIAGIRCVEAARDPTAGRAARLVQFAADSLFSRP